MLTINFKEGEINEIEIIGYHYYSLGSCNPWDDSICHPNSKVK